MNRWILSIGVSERHRQGWIPVYAAALLPVLFIGVLPIVQAISAPITPQNCAAVECRLSTIVPASMFGEDERRTEQQFAAHRKTTLQDVQNRYAASGAITCHGFGRGRDNRSVVYASGQLTARNDVVTTTAHTIIGKDAKPLGNLENCVFETTLDGRKIRSRLTRDFFSGFSDPDDANFAGFDWAVVRLMNPLPVEPYPVVDDLSPLFRWLDVATVTKVANFNFDNWGANRSRTKSLAECAVKPEIVAWSSGVRGIRTDCDISPGNSGGAILSELSGQPALIGIMVGTTAASFKHRRKFDLYKDYNIGALLEGEFLLAVRDMASVMSVAEVQTALDGLGYDPGPADGVAGKRTSRAIRAFQKDRGLEQTGLYSAKLSRALQSAMSGNPVPAAGSEDNDDVVTDLYDWRLASSGRTPAHRPDWLPAGSMRPEGFGPLSVWNSPSLTGCRNIIACLKASGAPGQALRAAYMLEKTGLVGSYVSRFDEFGPVDLVTIGLSYSSAEQPEYALVNSPGGAISLRSSSIRESNENYSGFTHIRRKTSQAGVLMNPRFESYRLLDDGKQRFVFSYPVTSGCTVCQPVAQIITAFDFAEDGRFRSQQPLALSELAVGQGWYAPRYVSPDRYLTDILLVQRRLNELGYPAGPVDGVFGQKTEGALAVFQREHGLAITGKIDPVTAEILSAARIDRQLRRFEVLLATNSNRTPAFGAGLLARIPVEDSEKHIVLANNLAGRLIADGQAASANEMLRDAVDKAGILRDKYPLFYASLLLNLASGSLAVGQDGEAERLADEAAAFLDRSLAAPANAAPGRKATAAGSTGGRIVSIAERLIDRAAGEPVRYSFLTDAEPHGHIFMLLFPAIASEPI